MAGPYFVNSNKGNAATATGADWANASPSIAALLTSASPAVTVANGEIIYVHCTHNNQAGAAISWTLPESGTGIAQVLSVDGGDATGASLSGTTVGNLYAGAIENTNGNFGFTHYTRSSRGTYFYGMTFIAGSGSSQSSASILIDVGTGAEWATFENCIFWRNTTSTSPRITILGAKLQFLNCEFRHEVSDYGMWVGSGNITFTNCKWSASGSAVTTLFFPSGSTAYPIIYCNGCDWSRATYITTVLTEGGPTHWRFNNCVIGTPTSGTIGFCARTFEFHACAGTAAGPLITEYYLSCDTGVVQDDIGVYATSSPAQMKDDDGTLTSYSLKMDPSTICTAYNPLYTPWFSTFVGSTGSKTFTVRVADTESALLKDSELWLEVEYVGGSQVADSPQSQIAMSAPVVSGTLSRDVITAGSNLTDSAEAWTGITETGTYSLAKTVTIDEQGYVRCRVGLAKDTTNPVYVDPKITVS